MSQNISVNVPYHGAVAATMTDKAFNAIHVCVDRQCKNLTFKRQNKTGMVVVLCGKTGVGITAENAAACKQRDCYTGAKKN